MIWVTVSDRHPFFYPIVPMKTFYTNALVLRNGEFQEETLVVDENGRIASPTEPKSDDRVVDLCHKALLPGLIDVHVHLREPGFSYKETILTGTQAAAHGGYTMVCAMPNLKPAPDCRETLEEQLKIIRRDAVIRVLPYGCITMGQKGEGDLVDYQALKNDVIGFSDDGRGVQSHDLMQEAMRRVAAVDMPVVEHCEVNELLKGGYIHDGEYCRKMGHQGICSESEWKEVERDIELAEKTGCQFHVCHVSTKESVELVRRAKAKGLKVSCETAPHYLLLSEEDMQEDGRFKMNPPLRSKADKQALLEGIKDGTIQVVATDHAPHSAEEKSRGLKGSAMGIVGIEIAFPLLYTYLVKQNVITLGELVKLMSDNPKKLFRRVREESGGIEVGEKADFMVVDLEEEYSIDPKEFFSKGHATPFEGWKVYGRILKTVVEGKEVYNRK